MIKLIKKAARWYFNNAVKTYFWMPTGTLPCPTI